jgi:hypothetical protein
MAGEKDDFDAVKTTTFASATSTVPAVGGQFVQCKSCGAAVPGNYCGKCGQAVETYRRSVRHLVRDVLKDIAHFDSHILRTARALFLEPGELSSAFREGRTQLYVPPVRLYLFVSLVFILVLSAAHIAIVQLELSATSKRYYTNASGDVFQERGGATRKVEGLKANSSGTIVADARNEGQRDSFLGMRADGKATPDLRLVAHFFTREKSHDNPVPPELLKVIDKQGPASQSSGVSNLKLWMGRDPKKILDTLARDPSAINRPLTEWIPRLLFVLLPAFALLLTAFYWRRKKDFYFVDHLVFSLNTWSFVLVSTLFAIVLAQFVNGKAVAFVGLCAVCLYLLLAVKRFYRQSWSWTGLKFVFVYGTFLVLFLGPALAGIFLLALLDVE